MLIPSLYAENKSVSVSDQCQETIPFSCFVEGQPAMKNDVENKGPVKG